MFRKPAFWIILTLLATGCGFLTVKYFPQAFPLVTVDLRMNRQQALDAAEALAVRYGWGPPDFKQAASFRLDRDVQNFVELEAGGTEAFREMLREGLYSPYAWRVRHYSEGETNETLIRFTPVGEACGFAEKLPENEPGAKLSPDSALVMAERTATREWGIDLTVYNLVEQSQETRPGGRGDHTLVYERAHTQIGEGRYRLQLVIGGDRLTELTHFIKIPEGFVRRHQQMRSANNTIAQIAVLAIGLLYVLGGCIIGLFLLLRQRWVIWRTPLIWGLAIASLQLLAGINQWPLAWMSYDTALTASGFLLRQIVLLLVNFMVLTVLITLTFMAAESLSRKAFPHHIQQWRLWSRGVSNSPAVLGRTMGGYLLVSVFWAYEVGLYFFSTKVLGWWSPSEALFQPDVLATYFPWLSSIAVSAQAGFWEESLFRAVPIASAAILGNRFGNRKAWILSAFVLQALIFSAAHANYATQPAYARLVELIIPSVGFGLIYLYFGLLPAVILHFTVDVVAFAMPLFVSSAPGIWINQVMVILLALVPLGVILLTRLRARRWNEVSPTDYNRAWSPPEKEVKEPEIIELPRKKAAEPMPTRFLPLAGLMGLILWLAFSDFSHHAPSLAIGRKDAKELAHRALTDGGIELPEGFQATSRIGGQVDQQDRFIWQTGGEQTYQKLMGAHLEPPHWMVRFVQFEGEVAGRAEEFQVYIAGEGNVFRLRHQLPEAREGASLSEDEARSLAHANLRDQYSLDPDNLKEISAVESKLPNRRDWEFTFADTVNFSMAEGEARIAVTVTGSTIGDSRKYVHIPEEWIRQERNRRNLTSVLTLLCILVLILALIAGIVGAVVKWSRKAFSVPVFATFFAVLSGLGIINLINGWPATFAHFSTAEPLSHQRFSAVAFSLLGVLFLSVGIALLAGFTHSWKQQEKTVRGIKPVFWGVSLGAVAAGLTALVSQAAPLFQPRWPEYSAAGTYIPIIAPGFHLVPQYVADTTVLLIILVAVDRFTRGWTERKGLISFLLILTGVVIAGSGSIDSPGFWLASGVVLGLLLLLAYHVVLKYHIAFIPLATAGMAILTAVREASYQAHPASLPGSVLAVVLTGFFSIYWFKSLQTK